jgi:hypothetical protein
MGASELRAELLSLLAEVEDAAAAVGLAVEAHAPELSEGQRADLLSAAGALRARLRTLRAPLPREDEPDPLRPRRTCPERPWTRGRAGKRNTPGRVCRRGAAPGATGRRHQVAVFRLALDPGPKIPSKNSMSQGFARQLP